MTEDQLITAAKAEGSVTVYSVTTRLADAAKAFTAKYGIKVNETDLSDTDLVTKVSTEGSSGAVGADFVLAQDGARVQAELLNQGYLYNYVPPSMASVIPADDQNPLVFGFINKLFIYNNSNSTTPPINNIWDLADPQWKGLFQIKDPSKEGVNENFFTMVTNQDWSDKIAAAYKDKHGADIQLTTSNAGEEWMKAIFQNGAVLTTSDTTMAENIGAQGQDKTNIGLFTYSKVRYSTSMDLTLQPLVNMEPFAGFYYPIYALMAKNAQHPNAAKLFIEYLLTPEGFAPWSADVGTYSANPNVAVAQGDQPLATWEKVLVREDPAFCAANRAAVEQFLNNYIQS